MANPKATAVVQTALTLLDRSPPVPYVLGGETLAGMDCQGLVEYCVRQAGGTMSYAGSNDMIRNACTSVYTLAEARAGGLLKPGWLLFILKQDGGEPAKYKADGIGNASHVGLYTGAAKTEVVHASSSNGCVCASTLKNAWTHAGPAKAIDYSLDSGQEPPAQPVVMALVTASSVNMRETPGGVYQLRIPGGAVIPIHEQRTDGGKAYGRTAYANANGLHSGWVEMAFVTVLGDGGATEAYRVIISGYRGAPLTQAQAANIADEYRSSGYDVAVGEV